MTRAAAARAAAPLAAPWAAAPWAAAPFLAPAGAIPVVGRRAGQRLARAELSKAIYHPQPSLVERVLQFVASWLNRLFRDTQSLPGGWWGFVVLVALAALLVTVVLARIGPVARARRLGGGQGAVPPARAARDHRDAAARLAGAGDYAGAICERVRAIAAELDERGVLAPRIGRTADEFAAEAARALPPHAAGLLAAARLFDEVRYGRRPGTRPGYDRVTALDRSIGQGARNRGAAPRTPAGAAAGTP